MTKPLPPVLFIALRHLSARWKHTLISLLSVTVGVAILVVSLSLTNGFEQDLVDKILITTPHINATGHFGLPVKDYQPVMEKIASRPEVKGVTPYLNQQGILTDGLTSVGILIRGEDLAKEDQVRHLSKYLIAGSISTGSEEDILIGSELARQLGLMPGDTIQLIGESGKVTQRRVAGVFRVGYYEYDSKVALIPLASAQKMAGFGNQVSGFNIVLKDPMVARTVTPEIKKANPNLFVYSWMEGNRSLLAAMALEKKVIFLVILSIILVASIGIANSMILMVMEKREEIGILKAVGVQNHVIANIFLLEGAVIGLLGIMAGLVLGLLGCWYLATFPVNLPQDIYYIDKLPVRVQGLDLLFISIASLIISLLASLLPARRASKLDPIQILRSR